MLTIYHNPNCSKSRGALQLVQQFSSAHNEPLHVVEYLKTPLTRPQLLALQQQLNVPLRDMVRDTQPEYESMALANATDDALLDALVKCPRLLQRPVVERNGRALIARPPEDLANWLEQG